MKNNIDIKKMGNDTGSHGNYAAGILPYYKHNNNVYFLLGRDKRNKWSDFGGKSELKDNNTPKYTAAREFFEETSGVISSLFKITNILTSKNIQCFQGKTYTKKNYYMYLLNIENVLDHNEILHLHTKFDNVHQFLKKSHVIDPKFTEKNKIQWVTVSQLYDIKHHENLRQVFHDTINIKINKAILENI